MSFGTKIRLRREELEFTQEYCAIKTGVSRQTWVRWEKGHFLPLEVYKQKACEFLKI